MGLLSILRSLLGPPPKPTLDDAVAPGPPSAPASPPTIARHSCGEIVVTHEEVARLNANLDIARRHALRLMDLIAALHRTEIVRLNSPGWDYEILQEDDAKLLDAIGQRIEALRGEIRSVWRAASDLVPQVEKRATLEMLPVNWTTGQESFPVYEGEPTWVVPLTRVRRELISWKERAEDQALIEAFAEDTRLHDPQAIRLLALKMFIPVVSRQVV